MATTPQTAKRNRFRGIVPSRTARTAPRAVRWLRRAPRPLFAWSPISSRLCSRTFRSDREKLGCVGSRSFPISFIGDRIDLPQEGVTVDGTHIYWANASPSEIGRANLDGSGVNESFITGASSPLGVAVSSVPEPSTGLLVIGGLLGLAGSRKACA
jgi:hypothetical protein